jgi:hypothetical protein
MDELVKVLSENGYARDSVTLDYVIANTMQDGQYSAGAHANARILLKYSQYGKMTVGEIKRLGCVAAPVSDQ